MNFCTRSLHFSFLLNIYCKLSHHIPLLTELARREWRWEKRKERKINPWLYFLIFPLVTLSRGHWLLILDMLLLTISLQVTTWLVPHFLQALLKHRHLRKAYPNHPLRNGYHPPLTLCTSLRLSLTRMLHQLKYYKCTQLFIVLLFPCRT